MEKHGHAYISSAFMGHNSICGNDWLVDSGASDHMTFNKCNFSIFSENISEKFVIVGDGRKLQVKGMGQIELKAYNGHEYVDSTLNCVLYVCSRFKS